MELRLTPEGVPSRVDTLPRRAALPECASAGASPSGGGPYISVMGTRRWGCMACVCRGASRADAMLAMIASTLRESTSLDHTESAAACAGQHLPQHYNELMSSA